jgi:hypothetical protein
MRILNEHFKCQRKSCYYSFTKKIKKNKKNSHIVEFVHIVDEINSLVNIDKTQLTNHILKGLCGKPIQNCAHIPILITPLLHQGSPQPNTQMRQPKVF